MPGVNFEVLLQLVLDQAQKSKTQAGVSDVTEELKQLWDVMGDTTEFKTFEEFQKKVTEITKKFKEANKEAGNFGKNVSAMAIKASADLTRVSSVLNRISNGLVIGGTAVAGGLFKMAKDFIANTKESNSLTRAWKSETDNLAASYSRIGAVAAREILPFLKIASDITEKMANFAEANPELVGGALRIGMIGIALGVIGKAVLSGIKLVADVTYIAASATQLLASGNNLVAANEMVAASGIFAVSISAVLIPALVIFGGILSGILVGLMAYEALARSSGGKLPDLETIGTNAFAIIKSKYDELIRSFSEGANVVDKFGDNTEKLVEGFKKMNDEIDAENKSFEDDRLAIIKRANADILKEDQSNADQIRKINSSAATARNEIIQKFTKTSAEDARKFETERANIIRDGGIEIQRIEADRLEKLRQLEQDHSDRVDELSANRDALGLVLEQRKFDRDKAELDRGTNAEIQQRRQDLAIRLNDLAANFAAERAQKQAQYIQDLKDNEDKRLADLKEQQRAHDAEIKSIREFQAAKLRELALQHREELLRIRDAFLAQVRDLDASLLNEQTKKRNAYNLMLQDLDKFLAEQRARLSGKGRVGAVPGFAEGGYTPGGIIRSHAGEFIANASTTRALERMIGGRLSQQNIVGAVAGASSQVIWHDQRRFTGEYSQAMRRENRRDTLDIIKKVVRP